MIKKINQYLFRSPDEIGYDNYLILIVCFVIMVLGILSTLTNWALKLGWMTIVSTAMIIAVFLPVYLYSRITGKYITSKFILTTTSILVVNFQWYLNYGSSGPVIFLFVVVEILILIFFKKIIQTIFSIVLFIDVTILFLVEYFNPTMFGAYASNFSRLTDLYIGLMIILSLSIFFVNTTIKFYINEQGKAQMADRLKSAFLANMSHEIRTPMNGILGFADLLKNPDLNGDQMKGYIEIIEKSGARMLNIINDIVDISKIESGLMVLDQKESNVNEQIEFIYNFFKPEVEAKGMTITYATALTSEEAIVKTDREKLFAILTNLVKNAIKFTAKGSIQLGYLKKGEHLEFFVKDTGIGIPKERLTAIFERFVQADISNNMAHQGAGLGLAITSAYVEMLGGKIWVESEEGIGSTFYFTLPYHRVVKEILPSGKMARPTVIEPYARKLKVLIVEDDHVSELLISKEIEKFSREILRVQSGIDAVEMCRNHPDIELVLLDIRLPELNGYEVVRQIRQFNKALIVIAQTAYGLSGDREKALIAGCNDYLSKPIKNLELVAMVQKYFGQEEPIRTT
jgi:hypothetical protein